MIQMKEYVDSYGAKLILDELLQRFNSDRGAIEEKLWNIYMNPEALTVSDTQEESGFAR